MAVVATASAGDAKIVFLAGSPSHGPGEHEHRAGCLLLKACLDKVPGVTSEVYSNGWPQNAESAFAGAATLVVYSDGGGGHPLLRDDHLKTVGALMKKGVGLVCLHYAVEPTKEAGEKEFLDWIGGCFETDWSVNPTWHAEFKPPAQRPQTSKGAGAAALLWRPQFTSLPRHASSRGVKPFELTDEWYFHMRFRDGMKGVQPILAAVPPASTMDRADGPHEGNPAVREAVRRGEPQVVAWAYERPDGGRGFGFTGGHYHRNWGNDDFRKLVLNAILWTAKVKVPAGGVDCKVTEDDLKRNLDRK